MSDAILLLPKPLDSIVVEQQPGDYKSFGGSNTDYPLKGVTFITQYGYLPDYIGEDGMELDFFVGSQPDGLCGSFVVFRPELSRGEHKFYIALSEDELGKTLQAYAPVVLEHEPLESVDALLVAIIAFKA